MKLSDVKDIIDEYFEETSAEDVIKHMQESGFVFENDIDVLSKEKINSMLDERDNIIESDTSENAEIRVDDIQKEIEFALTHNFDNYEVDFIIETLTRLGQSPCLVYDDNGLFAVSGDGFFPVVSNDDKIDGTVEVFVEKDQWFKTIREALKHYLDY